MPVSENEETAVQCLARRSSLDISGVPFKKRRLFRPPSPPPEEQLAEEKSSVPSANASPRNENGKLHEDLASSNVSVAQCSFNANKDFAPEDNKESSGNVVQTEGNDCPKVKIEESSSALGCDSLAKLGNEEKLQTAVESSDTNVSLAPNSISAPNAGEEINGPKIGDGKVTSDIPAVSENAALRLGVKEHYVSASEAYNTGESSQNQQNVVSVSLDLSLSLGEQDNKGKTDDRRLNPVSCGENANRSKWDLNTTMDAWEGTSTFQITADALNTVSDPLNVKPLLVGAGSIGGKQLPEDGLRSGSARIFSEPRFNTEDSLNLRLSPSLIPLNSSEEPSGSVATKNLNSVISKTMPTGKFSTGNENIVNARAIKSEPLHESLRHDCGKSLPNSMPIFKAIKAESVEKCGQEAWRPPSYCAPKLDSTSIKAEPFHEGNRQTLKTAEGASVQSDKLVLQGQGIEGKTICPSEKQVLDAQGTGNESACSKDQLENNTMSSNCSKDNSSLNENELEHTEDAKPGEEGHPIKEVPKDFETAGQVASVMNSQSLVDHVDESNIPAVTSNTNSEHGNVDNLECHRKLTINNVLDSHGNGEGPVSDEEKINLSGDILEEDGYGSEYESDGNSMPMDIEEDNGWQDYEDGEVQEPQLNAAVGVKAERKEDIAGSNSVNENGKFSQLPSHEHQSTPIFEGEYTRREDPVETGKDSVGEYNDAHLDGKTVEDSGKHASVVEIPDSGANGNEEIKTVKGQALQNLGNLDATEGEGTEQASDQGIVGGQHVETGTPGLDGNIIMSDEGMNDSALSKAETSLNIDDTSKDANAGGNRSRIINLSRACNASSPSKPLSSRYGRERLPDVPLERERLNYRGRDEIYDDVTWKFSRERYQDQPYRNSRLNFGRGRGRISSRIVTFRGDRNPERAHNSDYYNSLSEYGIPRNKYVLAEAEAEFGNYSVGPDGTFTGGARPGRKMDDDSPVFRHQPSRRRSPGWRDGPSGRGHQMVRRASRNIGEEGSEGVGLRHGEKFMRGFSDDGQDHTFTRSQTSYRGLDNQYVQGARILSSAQRRPIRSRSPGPWSSSKRRSPDVFGGPLELPHRRSPIYRPERMRSPDRSVFPGEMLPRRHGSPEYLTCANDFRDMDLGRDPGHPRSAISNRSPNGRVFFRNPRRYGIVDPRERTDGDDFFSGPMHSSRFNELGDENGEDRRRISERRVPMRSFRPHFGSTDGENFHLNAEDGPRPFRFHPNTEDPQFHEPGREREFDRRNKNRPGNAPRRPRGIEE